MKIKVVCCLIYGEFVASWWLFCFRCKKLRPLMSMRSAAFVCSSLYSQVSLSIGRGFKFN